MAGRTWPFNELMGACTQHVWEGWAAGTCGVTSQGLHRSKLRFETGLMCRGLICASAG